MLLTLRTTHRPATDLGHLLRKHPDRAQAIDLPFGRAHVVWPEATEEGATAALVVEVDPVGLVRGRRGSPDGGPLAMYVNDRPYVASSFLSVALGRAFRSAMAGVAPDRPALVAQALPLEIEVHVVAARGGAGLLRRLFEPLGYAVHAERLARDETVPEWGDSALHRLRLTAAVTVQAALQHLYVLLPVLDDDKHYWVGPDEVDKLVAKGADWLPDHPEREMIAERYLRHRRGLARAALARLDPDPPADDADPPERQEDLLERPLKLFEQRIRRVVEIVEHHGARSVVDLGCGEGKLLRRLLQSRQLERIVGVDVSARALDMAEQRLERVTSAPWRDRVTLLHGSATYRDVRLDGFDALLLVEVIEHIDPGRLPALAACVFGGAKPRLVVVTTPNAEYNVRFEDLPSGRFRHADHRFEWDRAAYRAWAEAVAQKYGYTVDIEGIGLDDADLGAPTQLGVFRCR